MIKNLQYYGLLVVRKVCKGRSQAGTSRKICKGRSQAGTSASLAFKAGMADFNWGKCYSLQCESRRSGRT